ncbi:MAG: DUF2167 domain-containing protein [Steroidobacteraceae bacterium]
MKAAPAGTLIILAALLCVGTAPRLGAATDAVPGEGASVAPADAARAEFERRLKALNWIKGPTTVAVGDNARLVIPEGYVFLDAANTARYDELNQNLSDGREVMVAPADLHWSSFLEFEAGGYVKDDDKIDADALLKSLRENTERANQEREQRGWSALHIQGWAAPPAYNRDTKRLEWATTLQSQGATGVNFFTKILGRRGHTSVVMVAAPAEIKEAEASLNRILDGYAFNRGETYAEWKTGDKVAEYGLAALVLGGAAAIATKKGLWAVIAGFMAAAWKAVAAAVVALGAWLRGRFKKKA